MTKRKRDLLPRMRLTKEIRDYILSSRQVVGKPRWTTCVERGEDVEKLTINLLMMRTVTALITMRSGRFLKNIRM